MRVGAIEAGGTTFVVAVVDTETWTVEEEMEVATTTPEETLEAVVAWLEARQEGLASVGVASFGPVDLDEGSETYGYITTTPKAGWANTDVVGFVRERLGLPVAWETDVNAAALAEVRLGTHETLSAVPEGARTCAYVTVGTGVGVGLAVRGACVHGLVHPEGGHVPVRRLAGDAAEGVCPFHGDCVEGLVCAAGVAARFDVAPSALASLDDLDPRWSSVAHYLAQLCATITLMVSPHLIVLGGGLMKRTILYDLVRSEMVAILAGYVKSDLVVSHTDQYLVPSAFPNPGIVGAALCASLLPLAQ